MKNTRLIRGAVGSVAAAASIAGLTLTAQAGTCSVDFNNSKQSIRGWGACTLTWQGALTDSDFNIGYQTSGGIGLNICRIRMPATTDQNQWASEVNNGAAAKSRGAIVFATPWSPPAQWKDNNNIVNGSLNTWNYDEYAGHMVNFVNYCRNSSCGLYAVSVQNEQDWAPDYVSCEWTASELVNFYKQEMGVFGSTKVITGESLNFNPTYTEAAMADYTARENVDIAGGHVYGSGIAKQTAAANAGKEVWMTEHLINDQTTAGWNETMKEFNDCMAVAEFNSYIWWYLKRSYGPIDENGNRSKRGCIMAQYARWVRPGDVRVACTYNPSSNVYVTAYKGSKKVIIAINIGSSAVYQPFSMSHSIGTFNRYRTNNGSENLTTLSSFSPGSTFGVVLPANSVTTYVEQ